VVVTAYGRQTRRGCGRDAKVASFYSRVSCRSNASMFRDGEREVMAQRGGRVMGVVVALSGGDAVGICPYAIGSGALDRGVTMDRATRRAWACERMVPTRCATRKLEARQGARGSARKEEAEALRDVLLSGA
jgi:hypothetical protein